MYHLIRFSLLVLLFLQARGASFDLRLAGPTPLPLVAVTSPLSGQALQGIVPLSGNTAVDGFHSVEVSFSYLNNPTQTWFLISWTDRPVANGVLAEWDTTVLSDGDYTLRMILTRIDGSKETVLVEGVRVRNYTPIETDTPAPTQALTAGDPPTSTEPALSSGTSIPSSATPIPGNPAQISRQDVVRGIGIGILVVLSIFAAGLTYQKIRNLGKRG